MRRFSFLTLALLLICKLAVQSQSIKGSDVLIIGDSFFAMSGEIKKFLDNHAKADGLIAQNDGFRSGAVSGAILSEISGQYSNANPKPKYVIMDAGGNDCLLANCSNPVNIQCQGLKSALDGVQPLLDKMKANGTKKVLWMRYPEPQGFMASGLKPKLDVLMPEVEKICKASTDPEVLWVDLRPVWGNNSSYTGDGIHPTTAGSQATADAFWDAIKSSNFFGSTGNALNRTKAVLPLSLEHSITNDQMILSVCLSQPSNITARILSLSGRVVSSKVNNEQTAGIRTVRFPVSTLSPGIYSIQVEAGQFSKMSTLIVP